MKSGASKVLVAVPNTAQYPRATTSSVGRPSNPAKTAPELAPIAKSGVTSPLENLQPNKDRLVGVLVANRKQTPVPQLNWHRSNWFLDQYNELDGRKIVEQSVQLP